MVLLYCGGEKLGPLTLDCYAAAAAAGSPPPLFTWSGNTKVFLFFSFAFFSVTYISIRYSIKSFFRVGGGTPPRKLFIGLAFSDFPPFFTVAALYSDLVLLELRPPG